MTPNYFQGMTDETPLMTDTSTDQSGYVRKMIIDAAGNVAKELNTYERKWRDQIRGGYTQQRFDTLITRRNLPLTKKIDLSLERIHEWCEAWDNQVAVSFSGGKDSAVLLWLVRQVYPACKGIFVNTGLEYPEVVKLVKKTPNVYTVRPLIPFHKVVNQYGYPMVSKKVARGVKILKHPTGNNQNIVRLYDKGINRFGEPVNGFKVPRRWRFLVSAPFEVSDKCCELMKKEPMHRASKNLNLGAQFIGTMASDSKAREKIYLQHGCNAFELKNPRSTPMGFWTEQDVLECIHTHKIHYASVYGKIYKDSVTGEWFTSGVRRTGCVFCGFGLHLDEGEINRFQRMYSTHQKLWRYCMTRLGLSDILNYMKQFCPDSNIAKKFNAFPDPPKMTQLKMFNEN